MPHLAEWLLPSLTLHLRNGLSTKIWSSDLEALTLKVSISGSVAMNPPFSKDCPLIMLYVTDAKAEIQYTDKHNEHPHATESGLSLCASEPVEHRLTIIRCLWTEQLVMFLQHKEKSNSSKCRILSHILMYVFRMSSLFLFVWCVHLTLSVWGAQWVNGSGSFFFFFQTLLV